MAQERPKLRNLVLTSISSLNPVLLPTVSHPLKDLSLTHVPSCHVRSQKPQRTSQHQPPLTASTNSSHFSNPLFQKPLWFLRRGTLPFQALGYVLQMCTIFPVLRIFSTPLFPPLIYVRSFPRVMEVQNHPLLLFPTPIHLVPHIPHPLH